MTITPARVASAAGVINAQMEMAGYLMATTVMKIATVNRTPFVWAVVQLSVLVILGHAPPRLRLEEIASMTMMSPA